MAFKLTFDFATAEDRDSFIGWYLDGGGEYEFNQGRESDGEPILDHGGPGMGEEWDWGHDGRGKRTAENYTIEVRPYPDDEEVQP